MGDLFPVPVNVRHQKFADGLLAGMSVTGAYVAAGFPCQRDTAASRGYVLKQEPEVVAYMEAVRRAAAMDKGCLSLAEVRGFLARIVRTPVGEIDPVMGGNMDLVKRVVRSGTGKRMRTRVVKLDALKAVEMDGGIGSRMERSEVDSRAV